MRGKESGCKGKEEGRCSYLMHVFVIYELDFSFPLEYQEKFLFVMFLLLIPENLILCLIYQEY